MINRANFEDVQAYLTFIERVLQNDPKTLTKRRGQFRHLLNWADETPFAQARQIERTFSAYLNTARADGKQVPQSASSISSTCNAVRAFFQWARVEFPGRYRELSLSWIATIRPSRARGVQSEIKNHDFYSFEDIQKIVAWQPDSLVERRDRAAAVFLYLSAMRADAFVSMPMACFDPVRLTIQQIPALGVRTKNHKAAITSLIHIPEFLPVVQEWDTLLRSKVSPAAIWYAQINRTGELMTGSAVAGEGRRSILSRGIKIVCRKAGVRYLSPHKFRHGHVVYALKRVKDLAGLKAVSQNVMHANVGITDGLYGQFSNDDVHDLIAELGAPVASKTDLPVDALTVLAGVIQAIQDNPQLLAMIKQLGGAQTGM